MIRANRQMSPADVADHYDELDPVYRRFWGEHVHHGLWSEGARSHVEAVVALSDMVAARLAFQPGESLVDIGCGYGATARQFASRGAIVTGLTLSQAQIDAAPVVANVTLRCADWLVNDEPDSAFDGGYAIESSEHMDDKPRFFSEARRALRTGGRLVVCAWLAADEPARWQIRHLLEPICSEGRLPSLATAAEYRRMAEWAGFSSVSEDDLSRVVARTWLICFQRFARALVTDRDLRRFALAARNRSFALSLPRLMLAYRTGAMRYGVFTFEAR